MTELQDPSRSTAPTGATPPDDDPLAHLHKMSTTAGVSTQDYVAINIPSLVALVLGLASVLAVVFPVVLLVSALSIVFAVFSLRQIRESNGTQTGRGFAYLGILLSLAIGGFVLARQVVSRNQTRADRQEIVARIEELGRYISARQYDKAYAMCSDRFQARVDRARFDATWEQMQNYPTYGAVQSMRWNQTDIFFEEDPDSGAKQGSAYAWVQYEKSKDPVRTPYVFRKVGGQWVIDDAPQVFPAERPRKRPTGRPS